MQIIRQDISVLMPIQQMGIREANGSLGITRSAWPSESLVFRYTAQHEGYFTRSITVMNVEPVPTAEQIYHDIIRTTVHQFISQLGTRTNYLDDKVLMPHFDAFRVEIAERLENVCFEVAF